MNERINNLRLDAGIAQLKDDPRLVVIDCEGNVIDPLIGLKKFAELLVKECAKVADLADENKCEWIGGNILTHFGVIV